MAEVKHGTDVAIMQRLERFEDNFLPSFLPVIRKTWATTIELNEERFGQMAMQVLTRKPRLLACETMSVVAAFKTCAEYSLYPDDLRGHAYLVPRWDKDLGMDRCNFMLGYRGWINLFRRSPMAAPGKAVSANRVYEGDSIEIIKGLEEKLEHIPNLEKHGQPDRKLQLVYAILRYKGGESDFDYVMGWQIQQIRDLLSDGATGPNKQYSPWNSKSDLVVSWMEKKTALRQTLKLSPALDDTMAGAVSLDEKVDAGVDQVLALSIDKQLKGVAEKLLEAGKTVAVPALKGSEAAGKALDTFIAQKKGNAEKPQEAEPKAEPEAKEPAPESAKEPAKTEGPFSEPDSKAKAEPLKDEKERLHKWLTDTMDTNPAAVFTIFPKGTKFPTKIGELREKVAAIKAWIENEEAKSGPFEPQPETPQGGGDIESANPATGPVPVPATLLEDDEPDPAAAWESFMGEPK